MMKLANLACAAMLAAASSIPAEDTVLQIDSSRTKVEFTLTDVLHTVHGSFQLKRGDLRFDPATGKASGELVVDAASGDSGSGARDRSMHKNVLESVRATGDSGGCRCRVSECHCEVSKRPAHTPGS